MNAISTKLFSICRGGDLLVRNHWTERTWNGAERYLLRERVRDRRKNGVRRKKKVEGEKAGCERAERRGRLCAILRGPNARGRLGRRRMKGGGRERKASKAMFGGAIMK